MEEKFLKRNAQAVRTIQIIVLVLLVLWVANVIIKWTALGELTKKFEQSVGQDNFHTMYREVSLEEGDEIVYMRETYYKEGNYVSTVLVHSNRREVTLESAYYKNQEEKMGVLRVIEQGEERVQEIPELDTKDLVFRPFNYISDSNYSTLYMALFFDINKTQIEGREYYVIENNGTDYYIDAETGLTSMIANNQKVLHISYSTGGVTDDDIAIGDGEF